LFLAASAHGTEPPPRLVASLERTMCYGTCPVYALRVYADGRVEYEGRGYVKLIGAGSARLSPRELAALVAAFTDAKYLDLAGPFDCEERTDHPGAKLHFDDGQRSRDLVHDHGCVSPANVGAMSKLEDAFDRIVKSVRWVGTPAEREALRRR
jgi:hypothetical protein